MIYLIFSIIAMVSIGNLMHLYQTKDSSVSMLQVFLGNYLVAAITSFFLMDDFKFASITYPDLGIGALFGALFLVNFLFYQANIKRNGLSISISVMRIGVLIPVIMSIFFFSESLPWLNYLGILVVLIAFLFLGRSSSIKNKILLFTFFFVSGFSESGFKIINEIATVSENQMLFYLFTFAFLINLIIVIARREKFNFKYFAGGLVLGVPNQLASLFFLLGLRTMNAAVAYPLVSSSVVLLGFLTDKFIWKTKFDKQQYLIYALIVIGVILLNIR